MSDTPTVRDWLRGWAQTYVDDPEVVEDVVQQVLAQTFLTANDECHDAAREWLKKTVMGDGPTLRELYFEEIAREVDEQFAGVVADAWLAEELSPDPYRFETPEDKVPAALEVSLRNDLRRFFHEGALQPLPRIYRVHGEEELREQLQ